LRALIFDSAYDQHRGVLTFVRIVDGSLKKGEKIQMLGTTTPADSLEVGYFPSRNFFHRLI
jgi:GTP-binding protein LepA